MRNMVKVFLLLVFMSVYADAGFFKGAFGNLFGGNSKVDGVCYAIDDSQNKLYSVHMNPNTTNLPVAQSIQLDFSKFVNLKLDGEGGAYNSKDKLLYEFDQGDESKLYSINPSNGKIKFVKSYNNIKKNIVGASFYGGYFYIIAQDDETSSVSTMYKISINGWEIKKSYDLNGDISHASALAVNKNGEAYIIIDNDYESEKGKLFNIDLNTGHTTYTGIQIEKVVFSDGSRHTIESEGLSFASDGNLYVENSESSDLYDQKLYKIDLSNGNVVAAAQIPIIDINDSSKNVDIEGLSCNVIVPSDTNEVISTPFTCNDTIYFSNQTPMGTDNESKVANTMYLHWIDRSEDIYKFKQIGKKYDKTYNTLAYNPIDNFLYATFGNNLLKIDKNGQVINLGAIDGLTFNHQNYSGVIGRDGAFYIGHYGKGHNDEIYKIDIEKREVIKTIKLTHNQSPIGLNHVDMTIDKDDKFIYLIHGKVSPDETTPNELAKVEISTGKVVFIGDAKRDESLADTIIMDNKNRLFVLFHEGGFVEIDPATGERTPISDAPVTALLNDGAMCPKATLDIKKPITVTIDDANVTEGDSGITKLNFKFTYDQNVTEGKKIICSVKDGTATNGEDYNESKRFSISEAGESFYVSIDVIGDTVVEDDENLTLECESNQVKILNKVAVGTILNDDKDSFDCNSNSYLFTSGQTDGDVSAYNINTKSATIDFIDTFGTSHINATGYNVKDNYIYGWEYDEAPNRDHEYNPRVVRIDKNHNITRLNIEGLPKTRFYLGDVDMNGIYYMANRHQPDYNAKTLQEIWKIDVENSNVMGKVTLNYSKNNATGILASDFAFNPRDNRLYTVNANNNQLVRIDPQTGVVTELGYVGNIGNTYSVIDFFDRDGNFYFYVNNSTSIFKIDISNPSQIDPIATLFVDNLQFRNSGDGARCANAPMTSTPTVLVEDSSVMEGDNGVSDMIFKVKIINDSNPESLTIKYSILDGNSSNAKINATAIEDYEAITHKEIPLGSAHDFNITVPVNGDKKLEFDEQLILKLEIINSNHYSTSDGGSITYAKGIIIDDDRPKGKCFATTDNHNILFTYDDLDENNGIANPTTMDTTEMLNGEGGAYRAFDGYLYQFTQVNEDSKYTLKKVDLSDGNVTFVKDGFDMHHVDAAEFYYEPKMGKESFYVVDKHGSNSNGSIFYTIDPSDDWKIVSNKPIVDQNNKPVKIGALAIDPYSGDFYGVLDYGGWSGSDSDSPILYKLTVKNDKVEAMKLFDLPRVDAEGLAFANDGKLYLETEELGSGNNEHKIYRVNLATGELTIVSNSGTKDKDPLDSSQNSYVDIETLSCNGGDEQVPPRFSVDQKDINITEGNPANGTTKELSDEYISFVISSTRDIKASEVGKYRFKITTRSDTATENDDFEKLNLENIRFNPDTNQIEISKKMIYKDLKVEYDESFYLDVWMAVDTNQLNFFRKFFRSSTDKKSIKIATIKVTVNDDDFTTFSAYDYGDMASNVEDKKIKTKIVGKQFVLTLANINNPDKVEDVNRSTTRVKVVENKECNKSVDELNASKYHLFEMPAGEFDVDVGFTIDRAMRDARVQFIWVDRKGTERSSCSADHFAIRPDSFRFGSSGPSSSIKAIAGENFAVSITADGNNTSPSQGYNETNKVSFEINASQESNLCDYNASDLDDSNITAFADGSLNGSIKYAEVGKLLVQISEIGGKEFAKIDENDTESDRFITPDVMVIEFVPAGFDLNVSFNNTHTDDGYAFYSDDIANAPVWTIGVTAKDAGGGVLKNYSSGCIDKTVDLNISLDINSSDNLKLISNILSTPKNVSPQSKVTLESNISNFAQGFGTTDVKLSFKREPIETNPAMITMDRVSAQDGGAIGGKDVNSSTQYQYMRAYIKDPISVIGKKEITTDIYYETYEGSGSVVPAIRGDRSKSGEKNWYKVEYSPKSGKMTYRTTGIGTGARYGGTSRVQISKKSDTSIEINATKIPERNSITIGVKSEFKEPSSSSPSITTDVSFESDRSKWSGKGKTGKTVDTNVSKRRGFKKMNW